MCAAVLSTARQRRGQHVRSTRACGVPRVTVFGAWDAVAGLGVANAMPHTSRRTYIPTPTRMPTPANPRTPTPGTLSPRPPGHAQASWQPPTLIHTRTCTGRHRPQLTVSSTFVTWCRVCHAGLGGHHGGSLGRIFGGSRVRQPTFVVSPVGGAVLKAARRGLPPPVVVLRSSAAVGVRMA